MQTSAKEVLATVARDLKEKRYTQEAAAAELGYATRQAVSAILSSGKYMTRSQAKRFAKAFGYYEAFLISGEGSLTGPEEDNGTTFLIPAYALILQPFDTKEAFEKAFNRFVDSLMAVYGDGAVRSFLALATRYVSLRSGGIPSVWRDDITREMNMESKSWNDVVNSREFQKRLQETQEMLLSQIYTTYCEMQRK